MVKYYGKKFLREDAEGELRSFNKDRLLQGNFEHYLDKIYEKSATHDEIIMMTEILDDIYTKMILEYEIEDTRYFLENTIKRHIECRNELMAPIRKRQIKLMVRERA